MAERQPCIIRIRRHFAEKGGKHYYHHADVIATSSADAMRAAVEGRVKNWRHIDSFLVGETEGFLYYEVLYKVDGPPSRWAATPHPEDPSHRWYRGTKEIATPASEGQRAEVLYHPKVRNLVLEAKLKRAQATC